MSKLKIQIYLFNIIFLLLGVMLHTNSRAALNPYPSKNDPRVQFVDFRKNDVINLNTSIMHETTVRFAPDEKILFLSSGDPHVWNIDTYPRIAPNIFTIKPKHYRSITDLTVVTNKHEYLFFISDIENNKPPIYALNFRYPDAIQSAKQVAGELKLEQRQLTYQANHPHCNNFQYSYSGNSQLSPVKVCDDDTFTYFLFGKHQPLPAIFAVIDKKGHEEQVNYRRLGQYLVVERLSRQFSLRNGSITGSVFNHQWRGKV